MLATNEHEFHELDDASLHNKNKRELVAYIGSLRGRVEELESYNLVAKRVQLLERSVMRSMQYQRRESIEIHNIPVSVTKEKLEEYCCNLLTDIENPVQPDQIHACHRRNNPKKTIVRFVNRKHADKCLFNRSKLKDVDKEKFQLPPEHPGLFINESLCRPLEFLFYKVRQASKSRGKAALSYNLWKGKLTIKLNGVEHTIDHIDDLIELGLASDDDRMSLFK